MRAAAFRRLGLRTLAAVVAIAALPLVARAQFPAELTGRVVEQGTSRPIEGASIEIAGGARTVSDASGAFTLRVQDGGDVDVIVSHPAYASLRTTRRLEAGRTAIEVFALAPAPLPIDGLEVIARRAEGFVFARDEIEQSGARTLGDVVRSAPGVVVRDAADGGQRASIRGSGSDAVLVLLDGVPANDPVTGEADLSLIEVTTVESVRVLPGARSARFGPRAEAGVIIVETRGADSRAGVALAAGSLGELGLDLGMGHTFSSIAVEAGGRLERRDGEFEYERPASLGGGGATLSNAAETTYGAYAGVAAPLAAGALRVRGELLDTERGLAGPMHAPTPRATQRVRRAGVSGGWRLVGDPGSIRVDANVGWQRIRHEDPQPSFGPPYFDMTSVRDAGIRLEAEHSRGARLEVLLAGGAELRGTVLEASSLEPNVVRQSTSGVFARAAFHAHDTPLTPELVLAGRLDRWRDDWVASHDATLRASVGPLALSVSHRSAFSPPSASDRFFRSGYAVEPNPDLDAERVRSEIELSASAGLRAGPVPLDVGVSAFRGDIDGMVVWSPDYRFVWSPRNQDVKRSGGEVWIRSRLTTELELGGWASLARVTYDWPGDADTVQVVYRPRYSGSASLEWRPDDWVLRAEALYTGVRQATPGSSNPLPAYWDVDARVAREWAVRALRLTASVVVDRLLDNTDSFVHGFPAPGRTLRFELRAEATDPFFTNTRIAND